MRYLMCIITDKGQTVHDYTEVTQDEEEKISRLYESKRLPATFTLSKKRIVSDTILGFTDKPLPAHKPLPRFKDWSDVRSWVHQQQWYKHKAEQEA